MQEGISYLCVSWLLKTWVKSSRCIEFLINFRSKYWKKRSEKRSSNVDSKPVKFLRVFMVQRQGAGERWPKSSESSQKSTKIKLISSIHKVFMNMNSTQSTVIWKSEKSIMLMRLGGEPESLGWMNDFAYEESMFSALYCAFHCCATFKKLELLEEYDQNN